MVPFLSEVTPDFEKKKKQNYEAMNKQMKQEPQTELANHGPDG